MYQVVFNLTPFYPEGGGQVGDKGYIEASNGDVVYIVDTKKENNLIIHLTRNLPRDPEATFRRWSITISAEEHPQTIPQHTFCTRHSEKCWVSMWSKKVPWYITITCGSTFLTSVK